MRCSPSTGCVIDSGSNPAAKAGPATTMSAAKAVSTKISLFKNSPRLTPPIGSIPATLERKPLRRLGLAPGPDIVRVTVSPLFMESLSRVRRFIVLFVSVWAGLLASFWEELDPILRGATVLVGVFLVAFGLLRQRPTTATAEMDPRMDILEQVVADETRRPWSPSTMPWLATGASTKPMLLIPAADYHLAEIVPIARELNRRDIPTRIAIGVSPWERTWAALSAYPELDVFALPEVDEMSNDVSAVLVMKDTGSLGPLVRRCKELGIPTLGKVEGAQDFWDSDTPDARLPYRNLDLVLCQGAFDAEALSDRESIVVGSTRLERLWWAPPATSTRPLAVINLNFVYGVRTADRKLWLDTAMEACDQAAVPYVISLHPAERAQVDSNRVTSISASRLLPRATVLISRFSTMPLEAMARGVPFIYHNPHAETVKTFADPMGAFEVTQSADQLAQALRSLDPAPTDARLRCAPFFSHHVDIDRDRPSELRAAEAIAPIATR